MDFSNISNNIVYLIHTADLAIELFAEFEFLNSHIKDNFYWFESELECDKIINSILSVNEVVPSIIIDVRDLMMDGEVFYYEYYNTMYLLNKDKIYQADLNIISILNMKKIDSSYVIEDNFHGSHEMKVLMKENGLLDEIYSENVYINYMRDHNMVCPLLFLYRELWMNKHDYVYNYDNKFNNPYKNILLVEEYLNSELFYNIDIDKCETYGLKYDKLPAKYNFSGFYSTTGRIFCSSDKWAPIQNVKKSMRDILYADKDCILVEFDYKSFEFDIMCQLIGMEVKIDPHTFIYDKLIDKRCDNFRDIGKKINYAFIYGMNERRLAESIGMDIGNTSKEFQELFLNRLNNEEIFYKVKTFEEDLKNRVIGSTIKNFFGRDIHFKKDFAVLNNFISSTAADFLYNKFLLLVDILSGDNKILLQNHDSILIQLSNNDVEGDTVEKVMDILKSPLCGLVGRIDFEFGPDWKNLS